MRCVECQTDSLTPGRYCECCGRDLSWQEETAPEPAPVAVESDLGYGTASPVRCGSCGGPSVAVYGDLCPSCEQAFGSLLGRTTPTSTAGDSATVAVEGAPLEASPSPEGMSHLSSDAPDAASPVDVRLPPPVAPEMVPASNGKSESAKVEAAKREERHSANGRKPAVVNKRPIASVPSSHRSRAILWAAVAVVIVAAIGVLQHARWRGTQSPPQTVGETQPDEPTPVVNTVTTARRRATGTEALSAVETTTQGRQPTPEQPRAAASRPKTTTAARPSGDRPNASPRQVASVVVPSPAPAVPAPVVEALLPAPAAAEPPQSVARVAPIGRLFEPADVDEAPQIATRVEPRLPSDLLVRPLNDVVIVRVLISQTGHPFRVNLLRRSKVNGSLDDAVVAAVMQWTFSPARKRGEAVSCWYNIGVPLGRAD